MRRREKSLIKTLLLLFAFMHTEKLSLKQYLHVLDILKYFNIFHLQIDE